MKCFDVAIVGGGAAGLMAAVCCGEKGLSVCVAEACDRVGKKLLTTGNGKCNLSHEEVGPENYFGETALPDRFFKEYSCEKIKERFSSLGLLTRCEDGRIYPYSLQASSVSDILRRACEAYGVVFYCGFPITELSFPEGKYVLNGQLCAENLILSCGGIPGAREMGYTLAKKLGHSVTKLFPSLCPLDVAEDLRALRGLRVKAAVTLETEDGAKRETGEVQFTETELSGICVFMLSRFAKPGDVLSLDLMPEYTEQEIEALISEQAKKYPLIPGFELLCGVLPKKLFQEAVKRTGMGNIPARELPAKRLAKEIKTMRFTVKGKSFQRAQVTAGGVPLSEISLETMESNVRNHLYFAGEILDVDGTCGGYNLHFAWSSAMCAAKAIAGKLK